ncbi:MAG: hypothetical protein [Microviridae sp.]|nr:MAG: hypothetical protein [Microviridae sp.]
MAKRRKNRQATATAKRSTYITPRAAVTPFKNDYWPTTHLASPSRYVVKSYMPYQPRAVYRPLAEGQLTRRPRRHARNARSIVSGMHDTPFKRPQIQPYKAFLDGLAYQVPQRVKVCVQRKQRREAIFATTGGGSMRRKSTNRRTLRSELRCK